MSFNFRQLLLHDGGWRPLTRSAPSARQATRSSGARGARSPLHALFSALYAAQAPKAAKGAKGKGKKGKGGKSDNKDADGAVTVESLQEKIKELMAELDHERVERNYFQLERVRSLFAMFSPTCTHASFSLPAASLLRCTPKRRARVLATAGLEPRHCWGLGDFHLLLSSRPELVCHRFIRPLCALLLICTPLLSVLNFCRRAGQDQHILGDLEKGAGRPQGRAAQQGPRG